MATPAQHEKLGPLRCPFCGYDGEEIVYEHDQGTVRVSCGECGATGPSEDTLGCAAKAWNDTAIIVMQWNGLDVPEMPAEEADRTSAGKGLTGG